MKWANLIFVAMLTVLCAGGADVPGPATVVLHVEQQRPCSCEQLDAEGLLAEEFSDCGSSPELRGTVLVVGGVPVRQVEARTDDGWVDLHGRPFARRGDGEYSTVLRVAYTDDDELLLPVSESRVGATWRIELDNPRLARGFRVYVGDTAEYVRLTCGLDGREIICKNVVEV